MLSDALQIGSGGQDHRGHQQAHDEAALGEGAAIAVRGKVDEAVAFQGQRGAGWGGRHRCVAVGRLEEVEMLEGGAAGVDVGVAGEPFNEVVVRHGAQEVKELGGYYQGRAPACETDHGRDYGRPDEMVQRTAKSAMSVL